MVRRGVDPDQAQRAVPVEFGVHSENARDIARREDLRGRAGRDDEPGVEHDHAIRWNPDAQERLVAAATELFRQRGYDSVTSRAEVQEGRRRVPRDHPSRPSTYGGEPGDLGGGESESSPADARPRLGRHDPRHLRRPV